MQNGDANLAVPETLFLFNPPADYQPLIVGLNWLNIVYCVGTGYQLPNYYSNTRLEVSFNPLSPGLPRICDFHTLSSQYDLESSRLPLAKTFY